MTNPIADVLTRYVETGDLAGASARAWRDGRLVANAEVGWRDIEARLPVLEDTIFRIASLTKPVTSTAALMLYDEGRFTLEDPISDWAPEFANMRVLRSPDGPLDDIVAAERPITFGDLLTHRSGITYGAFHSGPIAQAYAGALGGDIDSHLTPDEWIADLASLPLIDQPGHGFNYGASVDLLGFLIARMEDASLGDVLERRIFSRLGMQDTGFVVPADKSHRKARMYGYDAEGRLEPRGAHPPDGSAFLAERPAEMTYVSGGAGLWSTAQDYLAFARMFVSDGAVDGVRLLKMDTLRRMTANFLTDDQRAGARMMGMPAFTAHGFGLGVAVVLDPEKAAVARCKGGVGTVGWPGAFGGWWQADPTDGSVMVFLAHNAIDPALIAKGFGLGVYSAIEEFHGLASAAR